LDIGADGFQERDWRQGQVSKRRFVQGREKESSGDDVIVVLLLAACSLMAGPLTPSESLIQRTSMPQVEGMKTKDTDRTTTILDIIRCPVFYLKLDSTL
jgi:hypothetical protein